MEAALPQSEVRRSFVLNVFNGALFNSASRLIDPPLVLTWFISQLTASNLLVGLVTPLGTAAWLLPQVFVSPRIQRMERKMGSYSLAGGIRVLIWLVLAGMLWFVDAPAVLLLSFFVLYTTAWVVGGMAGLTFFDVVAKTIPATRRGSLFAWRQSVGGLLGLGASWVVTRVLNQPSLPFPRGHAVLFLLYGLTIAPAVGAFAAIREPAGERGIEPGSLGEQLGRALRVLRRDDVYRRYMVARLALGLAEIALPFYAVYAKRVLGAPDGMVGIYVAARVAAQLLLNLLWGRLSDRRGNQVVMRLMSAGGGLAAVFAIGLVVLVNVAQPQGPWLPYLVLPLFLLDGAVLPAKVLSGSNFLLELVPAGERPLYLGLSNTLMGIVVLISGLGGLVIDLLGFTCLFGLAAGLFVVAYVSTSRLPNTRETLETVEAV